MRAVSLAVTLLIACGGQHRIQLAGTWDSWFALSSARDVPLIVDCGSGLVTSKGTISFDRRSDDESRFELGGRWSTCDGVFNAGFRGEWEPDGPTLALSVGSGFLSVLAMRGDPSRLVGEVNGWPGEKVVFVMQRRNAGQGKSLGDPGAER